MNPAAFQIAVSLASARAQIEAFDRAKRSGRKFAAPSARVARPTPPTYVQRANSDGLGLGTLIMGGLLFGGF